ncbi:MAG TPA: ATP-binding protein [Pseudolabrys sp.]|nr:ATP-binding protein [Pseudolabrys sp.]
MRRALLESESQIHLIMDCVTDYAIFLHDLDGHIVKWNKGTEIILGYSAEELDGFDVTRLFFREAPDKISQAEAALTDFVHRETEGWRLRKDGSRFWASGVVQPIVDSAERAIGMAVVLRDMTKQRDDAEMLRSVNEKAEAAVLVESKLRGEIEAANIDLVSANRGLQQFTSIVAHDLRAPLKRIDAFMTALREDYTDRLDDEGKEMMARVSRGAARMELMLDSLLDYSRYNADAIGGKSADLAHVIKGVMETCDFETLESRININVADAPRVKGDPLLLAHVFQNLIGNSIKFRRGDHVCVDIEAQASGDVVMISISDNGIGIEARFADQVFDMFARLHDDDEYEGTGIGLTVCRKIVTDHGGRIWIDPDYDAGTRIYVTLQPAAGERQPEPDLIMQLHQTMQRLPRGAPGIGPDIHRNHHAHFDRKAR